MGVTKEIMRILRFDIMNDKKVASFIGDTEEGELVIEESEEEADDSKDGE